MTKIKEISNVEYQLRHDFLKSLRLVDEKTGEFIDYTNVNELFLNIDKLYTYLTSVTFRVIDKDDNKKRKRNKNTCKIWSELQQSKVENIDKKYNADLKIYREYQKNNNKNDALNKVISNISRLHYLLTDIVDYDTIYNTNIDDCLDQIKNEYSRNENYYNIQDKLKKQIKYYGKKNIPAQDI